MRAALVGLALVGVVKSQGLFTDTGADSFYWHNRYHGLLAMAAYADDPAVACENTFTSTSLQTNYPDSTEAPFTVLSTWGPTPKYGLSGYNVKVPEMNKDVVGWENFNATLVPLTGVGCDDTCMAHAGAIEAFQEAQNATNDWQAIKEGQGDKVWSSSGHGFGGMVSQIAAMSLKYRTFAYSSMTFGAPPVFNAAAANAYNELFPAEDSQRSVSHNDSAPASIPIGGNSSYTFVNTGVHLFGSNPMYGQDYAVCYDPSEAECGGGDSEADHWFYYTPAGLCGSSTVDDLDVDVYNTYNATLETEILSSQNASYYATATQAIGTPVTSYNASTSTLANSSTIANISSTAAPTAAPTATAFTTSAPGTTAARPTTTTGGAAGKRMEWVWLGMTGALGLLVLL
ncbi:protein of lipase, class 3 family [Pseudohyphozyma bogoriensis]|nr:protein of lipase, class 3 family [Pseudohyphozyma bogoriensis]